MSEDLAQESPPDERRDPLVRKIEDRWFSARAFRKNVDVDWPTWERYYLGHHWHKPRAQWKSKPTFNFIFSTIETTIPIMTDKAPTFTVIPTEPNDDEISEILGQIIKRIWVDQNMDLELPDALKDALIYGTGFFKVWWDASLKDGLGDVAINRVDPRHMFPSPGATNFEDADYVIFAANVPMSLVLRQYPDAAGKITQKGPWDENLTVQKPFLSGDSGSLVPPSVIGPIQSTDGTSTTNFKEIRRGAPAMSRDEIVTLVEMWDRDEAGNVQVTVAANGAILKPTYKPFRHNMFPFCRIRDYSITGQFWAMGEVQQLASPQDFINERRAQTHDILKLTGNPPFVADLTSGINPKALVNRPGAILYKNAGTEAQWMQVPQVPAALFTVQEMDKRDLDSISGILDVTQGRRPVGIEAAAAIVELQEAAQTRIRDKTRRMEGECIRRMGRLTIELVQEFYTEERAIRIVGERGAAPQFVTVNQPQPDGASGMSRLNDLSVGTYDVEIGAGSTMPVNKSRLFSQFLQMYRDGLVDQRAVLEKAPGVSPEEVEKIIQRMVQQQAQMMAMQGGQPLPGMEASSAGTASAEAGEIENQQAEMPTEDELRELEESQAQVQLGSAT